jgi:hypothetical protein
VPADCTLGPAAGPGLLPPLPGIDDDGTDLDLAVVAPDVTVVPERRRLADVADLDRPLGFRGNLVVFELRQCSQVTDHMAAEYLDPVAGVADPGAPSGISTSELLDYLEEALRLDLLTEEQLESLKTAATRLHREQRDWTDDLVLPTGQVFVEALKSATTPLKPFKLVHRGLDVLAAEESVRAQRWSTTRPLLPRGGAVHRPPSRTTAAPAGPNGCSRSCAPGRSPPQ